MNPLVAIAIGSVAAAQVRRWIRREGGLSLEAVVFSLAFTLAILGTLSTILGIFGSFTSELFSEACFLAALATVGRTNGLPTPRDRNPRVDRWFIVAIIVLGGALRSPPMTAPLAGHDQGTYRLRAEAQARSHSIEIRDGLMPELSVKRGREIGMEDVVGLHSKSKDPAREDRYEGAYRPGFYIRDLERGRITPQFFHLHPSLLSAFVLATPADTEVGVVIATWLEGMLGLLAFIAVAIRTLGSRWGSFAGLVLAVSPLMVWTHRNPLTEGLVAGLGWAAALAWIRARDPEHRDARSGAWLLGAATWVRGDAWLWGPAVAFMWWFRRGDRRPPTIFTACLALGMAIHSLTSFPYVHDEIARWLPPTLATPEGLALAALAGFVVWAFLDRRVAVWLDPERHRGPHRWDLAVAALAAGALAWWWLGRSPSRPFSRLDALPGALGWPLLVAAALGGLARVRARTESLGIAGVLVVVPVVTLWLYAPRNLPDAGLYYYGRYLAPVVIPCAILLTADGLRRIAGAEGERPRSAIAFALAAALLWAHANVLARSERTRAREFAGAGEVVDFLASRLDWRAVVVAGGEGWHAGFTFNQIGGALAMRHGVEVLPYRNREAAHAAMVTLAADALRPVYLLVNESSHHYTREGDGRVIAGADVLLSAPLVAERVDLIEVYTYLLTPDHDGAPTRLTRQALRAALVRVDVDPTLLRRWHVADPDEGLRVDAEGLPRGAGGLCLDPARPLRLALDPTITMAGPVELTLRGTRGSTSQTPRLRVRVDGRDLDLTTRGDEHRPRDTLGPFLLKRLPTAIEIRAAPAMPSSTCLHGGISELWLAAKPESALNQAQEISAHAFVPADSWGDPPKLSGWVDGRALTRYRPGTRGAKIHDLSLRVTSDRPLRFASASVPDDKELDVIVTTTAASVGADARLIIRLDGRPIAALDPPDRRRGSWQGPKTRVAGRATVDVEIELVNARSGEFVDVRDVAFFAVANPIESVVHIAP